MNKRSLLIIFLTVFIDMLGFGIVIPLLPLYAEKFGANAAVIGWLLASYLIAQALCAPLNRLMRVSPAGSVSGCGTRRGAASTE